MQTIIKNLISFGKTNSFTLATTYQNFKKKFLPASNPCIYSMKPEKYKDQ